jgi:hypothetical protein
MLVQLAVACDDLGCATVFEGDFVVAEDSTKAERLAVVLAYVEGLGWRVTDEDPPDAALAFCPAHAADLRWEDYAGEAGWG